MTANHTIVEITRVEDIQPGDHVTLAWNEDGSTLSGVVRYIARGFWTRVDVAGLWVTLGGDDSHWTVESATREVPALPTEPGSVIVNATIRGETGHTAILSDVNTWTTPRPVGAIYYHHFPHHIAAWEPARIVPEGGAS